MCTFSGVQKRKKKQPCTYPPPPPPPTPWLRWPAPLCASQGRFLSQLGVLGCVAACLYWSVDFLVAACTYLNIPPGHCSVFPASHSPPPPPLPSLLPPHLQPAAPPRTLFPTLSLLQPTVQSSRRSLSSPRAPSFLLLPGPEGGWWWWWGGGFFSWLLLHFHPRTPSSRGREKTQDGAVGGRSLPSSFAGDYTVRNNGCAVGFARFGREIASARRFPALGIISLSPCTPHQHATG